MKYRDFPVLIVDNELHEDSGGGRAIRQIVASLEALGFSALDSLSSEDGRLTFMAHTEISCVLIEWEVENSAEVVDLIRARNEAMPIFIMTERHKLQEIPLETLAKVQGYVWKMEDTPHFIAGRVENAAKEYLNALMPPFFKAMVKYVEEYKYAWHTPGHMGGLAFLKSPAGRIFYDFFW